MFIEFSQLMDSSLNFSRCFLWRGINSHMTAGFAFTVILVSFSGETHADYIYETKNAAYSLLSRLKQAGPCDMRVLI